MGFAECDTDRFETGFEKIAIFATRLESPTHVARQLPDGTWTSKLGEFEDIEHPTLRVLGRGIFGEPRAMGT